MDTDPQTLLLDQTAAFAFEIAASGFSNHAPMALVALQRMGASAARLEEFAAQYNADLDPAPAADIELSTNTWRMAVGNADREGALRAFFVAQAQERTPDALLRAYLPSLLPGVGAAAFHGILRLGYGLEASHPQSVALGLAYLASSAMPLGSGDPDAPAESVTTLATRLQESPTLHRQAELSQLTTAMQEHSRRGGFDGVVGKPALTDDALAQVALFALRSHADADNIASLHMLTGTHAMRLLWPYVGAPAWALANFWRAMVAMYLTSGAPRGAVRVADTTAPWADLHAAACASSDVHVIKVVYSCWQESLCHGHEALYRAVAARALG